MVLADAGEVLDDRDIVAAQFSLRPDSRLHQHLWCMDRAKGKNDFPIRAEAHQLVVHNDLYANRP
ncbi:hypothetical protein D3C87_2097910 [compost metagenome]